MNRTQKSCLTCKWYTAENINYDGYTPCCFGCDNKSEYEEDYNSIRMLDKIIQNNYANEDEARKVMSEKKLLEDKKKFISNFGDLLSQISNISGASFNEEHNMICISYKDGYHRNICMDKSSTYLSIIKEVCKYI